MARRISNENSSATTSTRTSSANSSASQGRPRPTRESSQEVEGITLPVRNRKRACAEDAAVNVNVSPPLTAAMNSLIIQLVTNGKHLARTVDLFGSWPAIIRDGLEEQDMDEGSICDLTFTLSEMANQKKFKALLATFTSTNADRFIDASLDTERGQTFTRRAAAELIYQIGQAKQNDNSTLKKAVIKWLKFPEGLDPDDKNSRGFKHDETARFLLPMSQYPFSTEKRVEIDEGRVALTADDWPLFLWKNNDCGDNPRRQRIGLFRGELLLKAAKAIFTSPSSANGSDRSRRQCNASKNNMTEITPAGIAYVATLLYYALCSDNTFNNTTNAGFNLQEFYLGIIDYFESPENEARVEKLLKWWNKKLFPNAQRQGVAGTGQRFPVFAVDDVEDECDDAE